MSRHLEPLEPRRLLAAIPPSAPQTFAGRVAATFVNAQPADTAVTTGQGTSDFTFGVGQPDVSILGFQGRPFYNKMPGEIFWLGTLNYTNGETTGGTEATAVTLRIIITMAQPKFSQPIAFDFPLGLISTPNDPNPLEPDYVELLPPSGLTRTFTADDGGVYTLDILGFSHSSGAGYNQLKDFYIEEGGSATARLVGSIIPKPRVVLIAPQRFAKRVYISEDAAMPSLVFQVLGLPLDQQDDIDIHWRLTLHTRAKDSVSGRSVNGVDFAVRRTGTIYIPNFGDTVAGGRLSISATFDLNGQHYALAATGLQIVAHPPSDAAVASFIDAQPIPANWPTHSGYDYHQILRKIAAEQSHTRQFEDTGYPQWIPTSGRVGIFGFVSDSTPADAWNWNANIIHAAALFDEKLTESLAWPDQQLAASAAVITQRRNHDHLPLPIASFTKAMIVREAIERFSGGRKYQLLGDNEGPGALYVLGDDPAHPTIQWRDVGGNDGNPFADLVLAQPD